MPRVLLLAVVLAVAVVGCVFQQAVEESSTTVESSTEITTTTSIETTTTTPCRQGYIPYKDSCCVDRNRNGLCDSGETRATWALMTVATTRRTTTTVPPVGCSDGIWNQNEVEVDCGGVCKDECSLFTFGARDGTVFFRSYGFKLKDTMLREDRMEYTLWITTPDGLRDERTVVIGYESWVDTLRFRVLNGSDVSVTLRVSRDKSVEASAPAKAVIRTIGGQECVHTSGGLCTRSYSGYQIKMLNRVDGGVRLKVTRPDGVESTGTAWQNGTAYETLSTPGIVVGVLNYMIPGGYSNVYVKEK